MSSPARDHSLFHLRRLQAQAPRLCADAGVDHVPELLHGGLPSGRGEGGLALGLSPAGGAPERGGGASERDGGAPECGGGAPETRGSAERPAGNGLECLVDAWVAGHPGRKQAGLFLTPPAVARRLIEVVSADGGRHPSSIMDPAVGAGVFLLEAARRFGPAVELHGIDNDPMAVAATRLALWLAGAVRDPALLIERIRLGDSLADAERFGVDLICGNPPFGNAIEKRTARASAERGRLREAYPESARGPYDRSVPFVRAAADRLTDAGRCALLVPRALLAARYAEGLREWMEREMPLTQLLLFAGDRPCPDAAIAMVGWVAERSPRREPVGVIARGTEIRRVERHLLGKRSWGVLIEPHARRLEEVAAGHPKMGEFFLVRSGAAVGEAYRMAAQVREGGEGWRLLTSGRIDRYRDTWGRGPTRHLGRSLLHPILPRDASGIGESRRALYDSPKIAVSGLSRVIRAARDERGEVAGAVGTQLVLPRDRGPRAEVLLKRATILINSAWHSMVHRARRGPLALSGGSVPLGRRDIEDLPFPRVLLAQSAVAKPEDLRHFREDGSLALPREDLDRLALLDALDPARDDALAQRLILSLAGHDDREAASILAAWGERLRLDRTALA